MRDFFAAYRGHLLKIQNELAICQEQLAAEQLQLKRNAALKALQQSLEQQRLTALKFAKDAADYKRELYRLQSLNESLTKEKEHLETQCKKLAKENKRRQQAQSVTDCVVLCKDTIADEGKGYNKVAAEKSKPACEAFETEGQSKAEMLGPLQGGNDATFATLVESLKSSKVKRNDALDCCKRCHDAWRLKHEELIASLQQQINSEKKVALKLRATLAARTASRRDLEQLFAECVEAAKKQVARRKFDYVRHNRLQPDSSASALLLPIPMPLSDGLNHSVDLTASDKAHIMDCFLTNDLLIHALFETVFHTDVQLPSTSILITYRIIFPLFIIFNFISAIDVAIGT